MPNVNRNWLENKTQWVLPKNRNQFRAHWPNLKEFNVCTASFWTISVCNCTNPLIQLVPCSGPFRLCAIILFSQQSFTQWWCTTLTLLYPIWLMLDFHFKYKPKYGRKLSLIMFLMQASYKFVLYFKHRRQLRTMLSFVEQVYARNSSTGLNYDILDASARRLFKFVRNFIIIMVIYYIFAFSFGVLIIFNGGFVLPYFLPFLNEHSTVGFRITAIYHLTILVFSLNTVLFGDMICPIWIFHLLPLSEIIQNQVDSLNGLLDRSSRSSYVDQRRGLLNTVKMHRDFHWWVFGEYGSQYWIVLIYVYFRMTTEITNIFYIQISVESYTNSAGMLFAIYGLLTVCYFS